MTNNNNMGEALNWDSQISGEVREFTLLPPGEYDFTVSSYNRGYFNGSSKMCACPKLELKLDFGETTVKHNLFWNVKSQWQITAFLICIGMQQPGVPTAVDWNHMVGSSGRAKLKIRTWKDDKGGDHEANEIERFLPPDPNSDGPNPFTQPQQQYTQPAQQPYQQPAQTAYQPQQTTMQGYQQNPTQYGGWKPGNF